MRPGQAVAAVQRDHRRERSVAFRAVQKGLELEIAERNLDRIGRGHGRAGPGQKGKDQGCNTTHPTPHTMGHANMAGRDAPTAVDHDSVV